MDEGVAVGKAFWELGVKQSGLACYYPNHIRREQKEESYYRSMVKPSDLFNRPLPKFPRSFILAVMATLELPLRNLNAYFKLVGLAHFDPTGI